MLKAAIQNNNTTEMREIIKAFLIPLIQLSNLKSLNTFHFISFK